MMQLVPKKMTNKELINSVLSVIESYGCHIKNKQLGNYYFLFDGNEDSICHFEIKEIPGFLFGIWTIDRYDNIEDQLKNNGIGYTWADSLEISPLSEVIFFTQYNRDLDKFKPCRSGFVLGLYRQCWEENDPNNNDKIINKEEWKDYDLEKVLNYMRKHPIKSAEYAGCQTRYIWDDDRCGLKILYIWIKDWYYYFKYKLKKYIQLKRSIFAAKRLGKKIKTSYIFICNKEENWSPRIDVFIRRKPDIDLKRYAKDQKLIDKFEDKWFNDVSILQYDVDILDDVNSDDLENDRQLFIKYKEIFEKYSKDTESKIIYKNMERII